jgi:tripartite-type tricarboxylate transporter receptor subunit TctC
MHLTRRHVLAGFAATPTLATRAIAQRGYPDRPVRLVVPYGPGTATDSFCRQVTASMPAVLGQPVVVENRPGANAIIGTEAVARSAPDGYTLLVGTDHTMCINPALFQRLPYEARDFAAVVGLVSFPMVLVVAPDLPVRSIADLVALAKSQPGRLTVASPGVGTTAHLTAAIFQREADIELLHVPYQTNVGQLFGDLLTNKISMLFYPYPPLKPHVEAGRLRALGSASVERPVWLSGLPTLHELGYRQSIGQAWLGVYAPTGTPEDRIARAAGAFSRSMENTDFRAALTADGTNIDLRQPAEFAAFTASERDRYRTLVALSGATVQ